MALFVVWAINRWCGQLWPFSWHFHTLMQTLWELRYTLHSLWHLISSFEWDWRVFSALLSDLASRGTSWACWAGGFSCYSWWLPSPNRPRAWRFIERKWWLFLAPIDWLWGVLVPIPRRSRERQLYWIARDLCTLTLCWFLWRLFVRLGLLRLLAREPPSDTTTNIHFYDENLNDESETVIKNRFLWRKFWFRHRSSVTNLETPYLWWN
jgi:hypothetical protein